jgi:hypothetical protein
LRCGLRGLCCGRGGLCCGRGGLCCGRCGRCRRRGLGGSQRCLADGLREPPRRHRAKRRSARCSLDGCCSR